MHRPLGSPLHRFRTFLLRNNISLPRTTSSTQTPYPPATTAAPPNFAGELRTDLALDPVRGSCNMEWMTHPQHGEDVDLTQHLLVDVGRTLRDHRRTYAPDPALLHQAAHRSQAEFLALLSTIWGAKVSASSMRWSAVQLMRSSSLAKSDVKRI